MFLMGFQVLTHSHVIENDCWQSIITSVPIKDVPSVSGTQISVIYNAGITLWYSVWYTDAVGTL